MLFQITHVIPQVHELPSFYDHQESPSTFLDTDPIFMEGTGKHKCPTGEYFVYLPFGI